MAGVHVGTYFLTWNGDTAGFNLAGSEADDEQATMRLAKESTPEPSRAEVALA
jgi:hypothetical protein